MDIKVGDVVHVHGTVVGMSVDGPKVAFNEVTEDDCSNSLWIEPRTIIHVERRALRVGDKVRDHEGDVAEVVAVRRDEMWIDYGPDKCGCVTVTFTPAMRALFTRVED